MSNRPSETDETFHNGTEPDAFRLEEYKALRKEVEIYIQESRTLERHTVIAVGAVWVWLVTNKVQLWAAWLIPVVFTVAVSVRGFALLAHFRQIGSYLVGVEQHFQIKGWEHTRPGTQSAKASQVIMLGLFVLSVVAFFFRDQLISK